MADRYYDDGSGSIYDPNADQSQQTSQPYAPPAGNPTDAWIPQIKAWYQQYLGRPASDADVQGHLGNPQGLTGIEAAIKGSPEATAYTASQGKKTETTTTTTNTGSTRDQVLKRISDFVASHPNANPSLKNDPNYWADRILQTHPDGNVDWGYWEGRFVQPEGPAEGGNTGTTNNWFQQNPPPGQFNTQYTAPGGAPSPYSVPGGAPSPYAVPPRTIAPFVPQQWNEKFNAPTGEDLRNTPGFMASQDAAQQGLERSAAANGSILSGGFVGKALPRALGQLAGQHYNNAYQTYQDRYKQFEDTNTNALNAYAANVGGYNADVGNALSAFTANNNAYQSNVQNALQQYNAQQGAYQNAVGNSLNQYDRRYQAYQDLIKNNLSYAQLGLNATTAGSPGSAQ
jgi:hypothetical protein